MAVSIEIEGHKVVWRGCHVPVNKGNPRPQEGLRFACKERKDEVWTFVKKVLS